MKAFLFNATIFFILFSSSALFAEKGVLTETQAMELKTPDGVRILLNPDSTWQFKDGKHADIEKDFTVPIGGGRIILISSNQKWGFVDKEIVYESDILGADSVFAKGHSVNADLNNATSAAQKQALQEATAKTKTALKKFKIDPLKVADCVKNGEKSVDKKEDFKKGTGWDVSISILINKSGLLSIADCAMKPQDTTSTKKKKKL
jgi:hypothetical protein